MRYLIIVPDGAADRHDSPLGGRTALEAANKPHIDELAKRGEVGLVRTLPPGVKPGSDAANLAVLGYDPAKDLTGRSPLEVVSMGIEMADTDVSFRTNLVTLSGDADTPYEDLAIIDHAAGDISTEEGRELIEYIDAHIGSGDPAGEGRLHFWPGVSYRHALVVKDGKDTASGVGNVYGEHKGYELTPPHDILGRRVGEYMPEGRGTDFIGRLMKESYELLKDHPVNKARRERGQNTADSVWIWGEGTRPRLSSLSEKYGVGGNVIAAVDLIKGIGICAGLKPVDVEGTTGTLDTNFEGKAQAVIDSFESGASLAYVHVEAPDECSHQGDSEGKVRAIELIDEKVVAPLMEYLENTGEAYRILIVPDHRTPLAIRTHSSEPVPYVLFDSTQPAASGRIFTEDEGKSGPAYESGAELADKFFEK
jgi:2,3-bisphosphoglycerate-independent phosphoglycerate mutase